jgi:hypothetical protein
MPNNVTETTPEQSNHTVHLMTTARLYLNSTPKAPNTWGQINPNLNDYHSDRMEIGSPLSIPAITNW